MTRTAVVTGASSGIGADIRVMVGADDHEGRFEALDEAGRLVLRGRDGSVRTLTAASIVLMSLALIAGIYGMNFADMPELRWHFGYFGALGLMAIVGTTLVLYFKKLEWW